MFKFIRVTPIAIFIFLANLTFAQIHWEHIPGIIGDADLSGFAISPDGTWYVTGEDHLYSSQDTGKTWTVEIEFGSHDNLQQLRFFSDGTPVFSSMTDLVIKRGGQWVVPGYNRKFEIYNDTLFASEKDVFYSPDKGETWINYIDMPTYYPVQKYVRHFGRHYIEFSIGTSRLVGEVNKEGEILRSKVVDDLDYFFVDSCANIHFFDYDEHFILDENENLSYGPQIGGANKFFAFGGNVFRFFDENLFRHYSCEGTWELIATIQNAQNFYPISSDTILFTLDKEAIRVKVPDMKIDTYEIHNGYYTGYMQEIPNGTKFLRTHGISYRLNVDASIDTIDFDVSDVVFGPHGWIYKNIETLTTKTPVSKDGGMTWDTMPKPSNIEPSLLIPLTEEIVVYTSFEGTVIQYSDGTHYSILHDSVSGKSHYYSRGKIVGDLLLLMGNNDVKVTSFHLITRQFSPLIYDSDVTSYYIDIDNEGTIYYVTNQQKVLNVSAYPYNDVRTLTMPQVFKNGVAADRGYIINAVNLLHVSKNLTITEIPVEELQGRQVSSFAYAKSGRWILTTFSPFRRFYISTDAYSTGKLGVSIKGQLQLSNEECIQESLIPVVNWKFYFSNQEKEYLAVGQENGNIDFVIPPGHYDVQIIPPVPDIWEKCDWPNEITVTDGMPIHNWNVNSSLIESCQLATVSLSAPFYRRCFDSKMYVDIRNIGVQTISGAMVILTIPEHISIISTPFPFTVNDNVYTFEIAELMSGSYIQIPLTINTSCNVDFGEILCSHANLIVSDTCSSLLYSDALCMEPIGSWDPNDKLSTDKAGTTKSFFTPNDYLYYKIRFQNTGTDTAFNIQITDELDSGFNLKSFEMVSSSHPCNFHFENERTLIIDFPNILLPDSTKNLEGSNGFFEFRIRADTSLQVKDTLINMANIFFDFNDAVATNTVVSLRELQTSVSHTYKEKVDFTLRPNPANDYIEIQYNKAFTPYKISIVSLDGRICFQLSGTLAHQLININELVSGIYLIRVEDADKVGVQKFIKHHW